MDDRTDPRTPPQLERVSARFDGGAFRRPPVLPIVAVLALLLGLSLGYGLAPRETTASATTMATPSSPAVTVPPSSEIAVATFYVAWPCLDPTCVDTPAPIVVVPATPAPAPSGGLSLSEAVKAASQAWRPFGDSDVVSAELITMSVVSPAMEPSDRWVWALTVRGSDVPCSGGVRQAGASPRVAPLTCQADSWFITIDYFSGELIMVSGGSLLP